MKGKLIAIAVASAAVWGLALVDLGGRDRTPAAAPAVTAASSANRVLQVARDGATVLGKATRALLSGGHRAKPPATRPPAEAVATGELGEGWLSPDYADAEARFVGEARDGTWAEAQEHRLHALLARQPWADRVAVLNCQQSMCRIVVESDAPDVFGQLIRVPGLSAATGIVASTPYSLRTGQLSVYFVPSSAEQASSR